MRHIQIGAFTPSAEWQNRADAAQLELMEKATWEEKSAYIKKNSDIWKDLGRELIKHFGNKCWYTDAANYGARLDVEHFRPKAKTVELTVEDSKEADNVLLKRHPNPARDGYWWLTFDKENLLLCAQVMNRESKRNFFPLHRDSPVASAESKGSWRNEIPALLDPRKLDDVCLVAYDEDGAMRPRADLEDWDRLRVIITNDCFGLSRYQPLTEGRQRTWQKCSELIEKYMQAAKKQGVDGTPNQGLQQEKDDALQSLVTLLNPEEPFSSVAACCLSNSPYGWARTLASQPRQPHGRN